MRIAITTQDAGWAATFGISGEQGRTVIEVPAEATERLTFAGVEMIRFDMCAVANGALPRGWANRWTMYPVSRIVTR